MIALDKHIQIGAYVFLCDNNKSYYRYIGIISTKIELRPWESSNMPAKFKIYMRRCSVMFDNEIRIHYGKYYKRTDAFKKLRLNDPSTTAFQQISTFACRRI